MSERASALEVTNLEAGYADAQVLNGVNLSVADRSIVAVVGPNGAGKSTLLKTICGLVRPTGGRVSLGIEDEQVEITAFKPHRIVALGVGFVPQTENVFPNMSVIENLEMAPVRVRGEMRRRVAAVVERWPFFERRLRLRAGTLSGGERKLLALARALMADPRVLLLDEPSSGLAPREVDGMFVEIQRLNESLASILVVEQNVRRALAIADYGYVLDRGTVRSEGPGPRLLHREDVAGASFLGLSSAGLTSQS